MRPLISKILRDYAKSHGLRNQSSFSKTYGFPESTCSDWWSGRSVPGKKAHRQKMFELTGNPLFDGPLTNEKKQKLLAKVEQEEAQLSLIPSPEDKQTIRARRLAALIQAANDDLTHLVMADDKRGRNLTRQLVKKSLGDRGLTAYSVNVRALTTEMTRLTLLRDGLIPSVTKEGQ